MNLQPTFPGPAAPLKSPAAPLKIAIIGSGISGSSAAARLHRLHDVTLYEKNPVVGGHTATVDIDYDGQKISVDTGFIVYNEPTYPKLTALFAELGVKTHESQMSFSLSLDHGRLEWSGYSLKTLFAQKSNLFRPSFLRMIAEILRFNRLCLQDRAAGHLQSRNIGQYLDWRGFSKSFAGNYLVPMAAAIWSSPVEKMREFPADRFVNFFENHRLIHMTPHPWRTVSGGSRHYLEKLLAPLEDRIRTNCGVVDIRRDAGSVHIIDERGEERQYDRVLLACHSDQALAMLRDASDDEKRLLSAIGWQSNRVILHRDPALMPVRRKVWAAWNYLKSTSENGEADVTVSYWMNRLQGIEDSYPLFVTLNPDREPDPKLVFGQYTYDHPQFDASSFAAQDELQTIQGKNSTWFAGAWTGYGFHEDGLASGLACARQIIETYEQASFMEAAE